MAAADAPRENLRQPPAYRKAINSGKGCKDCIQRKTNCDEAPICFPCQIYGTKCIYESATRGPTVSSRLRRTPNLADAAPMRVPGRVLSASHDPFNALPVDMTYRSPEVLYHFMKNRAMLARAIHKDEKAFNATLGLGQTDRTWLQMAICLTASHRCSQGTGFQTTFFHHRQNLLTWIREELNAVQGPVPAGYLSIIISMIQADSAVRDSESVEAHLNALISLLDARRKSLKGWRFYDGLAKRYTMIALCFTFVIQKAHAEGDARGFDHVLSSIYTQLANEFLRVFVLAGKPDAADRTDGPILVWLCRALQEVRVLKSTGSVLQGGRTRLAGLEYREGLLWVKAVSAFALLVGTLDWSDPGQPNSNGAGMSEGLIALRMWSHKVVEAWVASGKGMTNTIATEIWGKLMWLETDDGLDILREIAMQAQGDLTSLERSNPVPHLAPGFMYI